MSTSYSPQHLDGAADAADAGDASIGQLVGRLTSDLSHLFHDELALAKVEIKEEVAKSGKAAGMLGATGVAALMALAMISFAAAWGLAEVVATGFAFLAVAGFYLIVAGVLFLLGRQKLATVRPVPQQTVETLKEDVEWAKAQKS
ncbi:MAG: phage holin family protein [Acidimicrobiaceae bacterium]|nr:phage holin family protein [Acidimicrobiaceae bacterium]